MPSVGRRLAIAAAVAIAYLAGRVGVATTINLTATAGLVVGGPAVLVVGLRWTRRQEATA